METENNQENKEPSIYELYTTKPVNEFKELPKRNSGDNAFLTNPLIVPIIDKVIDSLENKKKINPILYFLIAPYTLFIRIITAIDIVYFGISLFIYSLFIQADVAANVARIAARPERAKHISHIKGFKILKYVLESITLAYLIIKYCL